ncbi:MAG TPA: hypothetical protein PKE63_14215, partial [Lacibacter sp.]|nr:hypothetical protein [Lacibacter sp.]
MNRYSNWDGWMVFLASCLVVAAVFPTILLHPNTTLFSVGGDGIKNYFTALYYLQHNSGIRFTGMNYPFGEHILFGDAQPGLMIPFGWLCSVFPALSQHHLAFFNYSVLTGMALGAPAVFLLLKEFRVVRWQALVAALCISFLSPQVLRAENHYGLSYFFLFPLTWLVCLRAAARPGIKWTGTGILLVVATGLLHFYLALLSCLFLLGYALLTTLLRRKKETIAAKLSWWGIPLSGLLLLQLFVRLTDGVSDRPQKPWGFLTTLADWRSILQPLPSDLLRRNIPEYRGFEEGFSYIGSLPIVFLACFLVTGLFLLFRRRRNGYEHLPFLHQQELLFFLSSAGLLLFAMGIPFIWNMEWLADRLSVLRQFRGLGRFAWAFYSVCTVLAVVGFSRFTGFISGKKYAWAGKGAIALLYLLWAGEAGWRMYTFHKFDNTASLYYRIFTENSYRQQLEREGYRTDHFQAVLCL